MKYDLRQFHQALSTAIRGNKFFPPPEEIREVIEAQAYSRRLEYQAQKAIREHDEAKAQWERERAEDHKERGEK